MATADLDPEEFEALEEREILYDLRRERKEHGVSERAALDAGRAAESRYDFAGYPIRDDTDAAL